MAVRWFQLLVAMLFASLLITGCPLFDDDDDDDATDDDDAADDDDATDDDDAAPECTCTDAGVTLTAVSGCENFGGDEEECSGWSSCETENGFPSGSSHASGTELTCFGCTIRITCP